MTSYFNRIKQIFCAHDFELIDLDLKFRYNNKIYLYPVKHKRCKNCGLTKRIEFLKVY